MKNIIVLTNILMLVMLTGCSVKTRYYPSGQLASRDWSAFQNQDGNTMIAWGDAIPGDPFAPLPVINNPQATDEFKVGHLPFNIRRPGQSGTTERDFVSSQSLGSISMSSSSNTYNGGIIQERYHLDSTPFNGTVRNAGWSAAAILVGGRWVAK